MTAPKKFKKVYAYGGRTDPNDMDQMNAITSSGLAATSLIGSVADAWDKGNSHGRQSGLTTGLKQGATLASTGAKIGGMFGPEGALIGAGVGFVGGVASGLIGSHAAHVREMAEDRYNNRMEQLNSVQQGEARIANDPSLIYGNRYAQNFCYGGKIMKSSSIYAGGGTIGGPGGGGVKVTHEISALPANNDPYWKLHPLLTEHTDRLGESIPWGTTWKPFVQPITLKEALNGPEIIPSDKALGYSNTFYPSNSIPTLKSPDTIQPSANYSRYKHGGKVIIKHNPPTNNGAFADYSGQQIYKHGGGIHINPANKGKFNALKARTGKSTEELTHSKNPLTRKRAIFAQNAAKWHHKAEGGQIDPEDMQTQNVPGGSLTPLNSTAVAVNGNSHSQGGVQLPSAEVEGGESIAKGFVFSNTLGFADLHKPIARAIGKIEAKPMNPVRRRTLEILKGREQGLAIAQEVYKRNLGIPSDID